MNYLPHLAARVISAPLMVEHARLETILSVIGPRIGVETTGVPPGFKSARDTNSVMVTPTGIAVIQITGTLVKRTGSIDVTSGLLGYSVIEEMLMEAATDPAVGGVLLDIDSPGGEVGGVFDLADLIRETREVKPVYAVADDAFSAAYMLASSADRIYLSKTGGVGSIGVIAVHVDESERNTKEGRKFTTVFAGAHKNDFSLHEPLSDTARNRLQSEVDRIYGLFISTVAHNRCMTEEAVRATEAGLFFGADAIKAGLADRVGTLRDALSDLTATLEMPKKTLIHAAAAPLLSSNQEIPMPDKDKTVGMTTKPKTTQSPEAPPKTADVAEMPKQEAEPTLQPQPSSKPADVVDLDKVRSEKAAQMRQEAEVIVEMCALANMSVLAGEFIAKGMDVNAVRKDLLARRAIEPEIHSHVMPGDGTQVRSTENLEVNPVVVACQRLAKQSATGE